MSGLEIVGAAASVAGLLKFVEVISRVGGDIIHARKEKQQFRIILGDLQAQLGALQDLQQDAQGYPEQLYFLSLFQQRQGSPLKSGDQRGALLGIARAMKRMEHKLRERSTLKRRVLQLRWTLDKEEVKELMSEIREWQSQIQLVMQQDQLKLTMKILTLGKDTNSVVRNIDTVTGETRDVTQGIASTTDRTADQTQRIETVTVETHSATQGIAQTSESIAERTQRIENATAKTQSVTQGVATATDTIAERTRRIEQLESSIQADSLALRLRKETKDKKELHETIADWLSRLDFNARHSEIYNGSIDISKEFTESPEFQAWRSGRPWILFCWADAGAGKVSLASPFWLYQQKLIPTDYAQLVNCRASQD